MGKIVSKHIKNLRDHLSANFSSVNRSSAIFWIGEENIKSIFSVTNYWSYKNNNNKVRVFANWRTKSGEIISQEILDFSDKHVINLKPSSSLLLGGSLEIEAHSDENLKIPYSAVMGIYESTKNISMVHSYSRILNDRELIQNDKLEVKGSEGCWVLKDSEFITSFSIFHNGNKEIKNFSLSLNIRNSKGETLQGIFKLDVLKKYQTVKLVPKEVFNDLINFLDGEYGSATIDYILGGAFTRMLIGWESNNGQMTVTHSNFNYGDHESDYLKRSSDKAYVIAPAIKKDNEISLNDIDQLIIYEGGERININYIKNNQKIPISENQELINLTSNKITFESIAEPLPSRIVNGLVKRTNKYDVGYECSLGVVNNLYPKKRFHWALASFKFKSCIYATVYRELFGDVDPDEILIFKLYGTKTIEIPEKKFKWGEISSKIENGGYMIEDIFKDKINQDSYKDFFYISVFSNYGGFYFFTDLIKNKLRALEHAF